ncbi:MAG: 4-hydroxy-tetrahydrodipicolinate synthase [Clostridia bacterium]|nr:4-hydroxy-tetrahydrodipicolinate synthase [Clostridia bacterium]MBQ3554486.1 4-hydroxy-tetrahydrodipicolinate synthase [Clostridia bacterium]
MAKKTIFTGAGVAIVTPFDENGINYEAFGNIIEYQIAHKTDAIIVCGTTGESSTMPDAEHLAAIDFAVKKVAGRIPVIAGAGSNDTAHGVNLCKEAEALGVDGLLLVTPYYNKTTQKGLYEHYKAMAEAVSIPIILYNVPSRTGLNIDIKTVKKLSAIENIVAVKEASGNIAYATQLAAECPEMDIYSGNDDMIVPIMSLGGKGVISVLSNVMPEETHDICEKYLNGDVKGSLALQLKLLNLVKALFIEVNPIPVKTAMNLMGMNVGKLRMPLCDMEESNLEILKSALAEVGLI